MKDLIKFIFSTRLTAIIIISFAVSIAAATFIENDFGSQTARAIVYNAWWFNILLFIGMINLAGIIILNKLYRKEKRTIFLFHLAFLLILAGAAITRFFGFEGFMHIREGEGSNIIVSDNSYFRMSAQYNGTTRYAEKHVYLPALTRKKNKIDLEIDNRTFTAQCLQVIPDAVETAVPDPSGSPMIELVVSGSNGRQTVVLSHDARRIIGNMVITLNQESNIEGINIKDYNGELTFRSPFNTVITDMGTQRADTLSAGKYHPLKLMSIYNFNGILVVPRAYLQAAKIDVKTAAHDKNTGMPDALLIKVSSGSSSRLIHYFAMENAYNEPIRLDINGAAVDISYGAKIIPVPFELELKEFILERYPGSNSPSWFESKVVLNDAYAGILEERRVFMNNVLRHKGYRFYQSSYDSDEMGTVFSVNHDFAGTLFTYSGYLLLAAGIVLSLLNRNSRFRKLSSELDRIRKSDRFSVIMIVLIFGTLIPSGSVAQEVPDSFYIHEKDAAKFGQLLIQDPGGRIKPVNTLSSELLRKVSRKTTLLNQTPDQVFLGMMVHPEYWQHVPMIKVGHPEIKKILGTTEPMVSFASMFDIHSSPPTYILLPYVNTAYQKRPAMRDAFDTEVIRLDERVNLCYQTYTGNLLRIFPAINDPNKTWYSPSNLDGVFDEGDSVFTSSIIPIYLQTLANDPIAGSFMTPDEAFSSIRRFQLAYGGEDIPSDFKVRIEILYNRLNLFDRLGSVYGIVGFILLVLQFVSVFYPRLNLKPAFRIGTTLVLLVFAFHLAGLAGRWVISGHAPWSNGYEALVYIAFATVLAGIIFSRKSRVTLPITALLAWLILHVAHLNWMDPEITNLVPVLKSYWLLIHVAIITASYGFLAMGALMSFTNLVLMIAQNRKNYLLTGRMITEFSIVIEMALILGLYMLTIGTFLGGVWANESWGRYWGWDPKETWALVSILIYAFVAHMRLIPGLKGNYIFNLLGLLSFSTIIMTYFGVNYYLSGLHSYAKGDPLPVPSFVYYTLGIITVVAILAWLNRRRLQNAGISTEGMKQKSSTMVDSKDSRTELIVIN